MAKIWPVYEGPEPTRPAPWASMPFEEAIELLKLEKKDYLGGYDTTPRFGDVSQDRLPRGFKHIVVELDKAEAKRVNWSAGFYRAKVKPPDAFNLLLKRAAAKELGSNNVLRVITKPAVDSNGNGAIKVTVVVAENTIGKVANNAVLNALVGLRERLHEMRDDRTPIIEYATEKELKAYAGR